ncbi:MAG: hypothetical protein IKF07_05840 [Eubacterium sp.]|nr:hypothetical protein [Eubacterium sp.]
MAINLKVPDLPKLNKGKVPTKNYINIVVKKKKVFSLQRNLPLILAIVLIMVVLGKFLVVDRITATLREANRLQTIESEIDDANSKIEQLQAIDDIYAHYTVSGMTEEELGRVDRVKAMKLIDKAFLRGNVSKSWNLTGNTMTLEVNGPSLRELNDLAVELEEKPIVERCVISSARKGQDDNDDGKVAVTFVIYLKQPEPEE